MGIDLNGAQLLIQAYKSGVSFKRMATLGRQALICPHWALLSIVRKAGFELSPESARELESSAYAEPFFRLLGAAEIVAVDASNYEGAEIVHDMNRPIPAHLVSSFDLVLDGGTLEHVFEFPTALRNATQMVRPDGRFISITMASNFCGHGFYQFSPELFYRFLSTSNGYAMESCIIWEDTSGSKFYQVPDPDSVRSRIELTSDFGAYMMVRARKIAAGSREFIPQQSDYVRHWAAEPGRPATKLARMKVSIRNSRALWPVAVSVRKLLQNHFGNVEMYHRRRIKRMPHGVLTPLEGMRVIA